MSWDASDDSVWLSDTVASWTVAEDETDGFSNCSSCWIPGDLVSLTLSDWVGGVWSVERAKGLCGGRCVRLSLSKTQEACCDEDVGVHVVEYNECAMLDLARECNERQSERLYMCRLDGEEMRGTCAQGYHIVGTPPEPTFGSMVGFFEIRRSSAARVKVKARDVVSSAVRHWSEDGSLISYPRTKARLGGMFESSFSVVRAEAAS